MLPPFHLQAFFYYFRRPGEYSPPAGVHRSVGADVSCNRDAARSGSARNGSKLLLKKMFSNLGVRPPRALGGDISVIRPKDWSFERRQRIKDPRRPAG